MPIYVKPLREFPEAKLIQIAQYGDNRGQFQELYREDDYTKAGLPEFVQDNLSESYANTLRGLHYQWPNPQGKLVTCVQGRIIDIIVDLRRGSKTFGQHARLLMESYKGFQLYVPEGFAHGFYVPTGVAIVNYKCTRHYDPKAQRGVAWNDGRWHMDWRLEPERYPMAPTPFLSDQDQKWAFLNAIPKHELPSPGDCLV